MGAPESPGRPEAAPEAKPEFVSLAIAKQARREAAETVARAAGALARGEEQHAETEARLARFKDLDERIATASAERVKRGLPAQPGESLVAEYLQRGAAREQLELCASVLRVLQAEHDAARAVLREAEMAVDVEACKVMLAEAERLAAEIGTAYRRIGELSDSLVGLDVMLLAAFPTLPPAPALQMRAALGRVLEARQPPKPSYVPGIAGEQTRQAVSHWRKRHIELVR
jgi:hypothetical protein